jgi:D-3-phosphoglycerate dehydrogenase
MKVLICDPTDVPAIERMRAAGIDVHVQDDISAEELLKVAPAFDGMVVRSRTKVTAALIDAATNLQVIVRGGVGLDNIDVQRARSKGITVLNTPAASSASVAELTIGYLFALARRIPDATASMRAGRWDKKALGEGSEIAGKSLGLVGCGRIGREVAKRAAALGMNVRFTDVVPVQLPEARQVSQDEILAESDYISLHVPYSAETHHIIGVAQLARMKDGVYIINCARGGTVDENALYDAIISGKVAGAALDVFADEKVDRGARLFTLPQVIGSPHIGAGTKEATGRVGGEVADLLIGFYRDHF